MNEVDRLLVRPEERVQQWYRRALVAYCPSPRTARVDISPGRINTFSAYISIIAHAIPTLAGSSGWWGKVR
jgi:hypothetical protein